MRATSNGGMTLRLPHIVKPDGRPGGSRAHTSWIPALPFVAVTVIAYVAGIYLGKVFFSETAQFFSEQYTNQQAYRSFSTVFLRMFAASYLQLTASAFLGLHVFGSVFLVMSIAINGVLFGVCAAGVATTGGAKMLAIFWLINGMFILCSAIMNLWLCCAAYRTANGLFRLVYHTGGLAKPQTPTETARNNSLLKRYIMAILCAAIYCCICALIAVFFSTVFF